MVKPPLSVAELDEAEATPARRPAAPWWKQAMLYVLAGLRICRRDIAGIITLVGLFSLPSLAAVVVGSYPGTLAYWIGTALPWITITLGNISMVLAIEALDAGQPIVPAQILPAAIRWFPRYIVTNGITTFLFWGIFTPLQWLLGQETIRLNWPPYAPILLLIIPMLIWHVHLVFATYAAIVDNHPGLRSVIISISMTRRRWLMVATAFVGSVLVEAPVVGPLYLLIMHVTNPVVATGFTWMLVMFMRPLFIATLHEIYEDFRPLPPPHLQLPMPLMRFFSRQNILKFRPRSRGAGKEVRQPLAPAGERVHGHLIQLTTLVSRYGRRL
ncbi:MAG: hypothetical protein IRZ31_10415 [Thermogemmatispora sp.]|uniref:hypothetical protein n=1 Tax=Thermogemmatispora sp. TaxID=1968838 RepID=UPI00262F6B2C|nr:hypothetical protein [Thermogemmatispora sp.]MBX5457304.1 hypothetical protein [Thermogemmatispora sp.]